MTRILISAIVLSLIASWGARAQSTHELTPDAAKPMLDLENRWVTALVRADTAELGTILADSYIDSDEGGWRTDKAGVISVLKSGALKITAIKMSDSHVYRYGNAAIVVAAAQQTGTFKGHALTPKLLFTDTLIIRQGRWLAVASQRTPAAN
jgi:hypothetical protein